MEQETCLKERVPNSVMGRPGPGATSFPQSGQNSPGQEPKVISLISSVLG